MTTKSKSQQNLPNAPKRIPTWEEVIGDDSMFDNCHLTDLNKVEDNWAKLSKDKVLLQLLSLPAVIHYALRDTVEEFLAKGSGHKSSRKLLKTIENAGDKTDETAIIDQTTVDCVVANILHNTGGPENLLAILEEQDSGYIKKIANSVEKRESELSRRREMFGAINAYSTLTSGLIIQILTGIVCISLAIYFVISNPSSYLSVILILCGLVVSLSRTHTISKLLAILNKLFKSNKNK